MRTKSGLQREVGHFFHHLIHVLPSQSLGQLRSAFTVKKAIHEVKWKNRVENFVLFSNGSPTGFLKAHFRSPMFLFNCNPVRINGESSIGQLDLLVNLKYLFIFQNLVPVESRYLCEIFKEGEIGGNLPHWI
jgi:hypothetical protein